MNKQKLIPLMICSCAWMLSVTGCEIVTEQNPPPIVNPAGSVVINEVFILPPPSQNFHYWVEFYNPTANPVDVSGWTCQFKTYRYILFYSFPTPDPSHFRGGIIDTVKHAYDVPLNAQIISDTSGRPTGFRHLRTRMDPYCFLTFVSDVNRMLNYTTWGPGGGDHFAQSTFIGSEHLFYRADTLQGTQGDSIVISQLDSLILVLYPFSLETTDQLVLKDSSGATVDVFRYGNYVYPGPDPDPYPNNVSMGPVVNFQSFARFAGAYKTGPYSNSAADFYVTGVQIPYTVPIPQWLSQAYKR